MLTIATCALIVTICVLGKEMFAPKMTLKPIKIKKEEHTPSQKHQRR